jgi:hypothetical protein
MSGVAPPPPLDILGRGWVSVRLKNAVVITFKIRLSMRLPQGLIKKNPVP